MEAVSKAVMVTELFDLCQCMQVDMINDSRGRCRGRYDGCDYRDGEIA